MQYLLSILICLVLGFMTGVTWNRMESQTALERSRRQQEEQLSQQLAALASQSNQLARQRDSAESRIKKEHRKVLQLRRRLHQFRQQFIAASQQQEYVALLERDNSELQGAQKRLAQQNQTLKAQLEALQYELAASGAERQELLDSLSQANRKLNTIAVLGEDRTGVQLGHGALSTTSCGDHYLLRVDCLDDLEGLQTRPFAQVMRRILALQTDPVPAGGDRVLKYRYANVYRIRSGSYRICYLLKDDPLPQIQVVMVGNRQEDTYDDLERRLG